MKRATFVKVALSMMVAVAATFGGGSAFAQGKVIKMIPGGDLKIIDPIQNASYISRNHGYMVYDTLFSVDSKGQVKPQMIDTYTLSPDKKTYTFTLRQGLKWHDGAPVTAADCVASIKRWGAKDVSGTLVMRELASLDVVNERTFTLTLKQPFGLVIDALGKPSSNVPFMMPERIAKTDPNQQITDATGSGPFIFKKDEWVPGNKVVYVKNPNYVPRNEPADGLSGGKVVKVDRVEWIYIPDQNTALAALTNGEADIFELPQADFIPTLEKTRSATRAGCARTTCSRLSTTRRHARRYSTSSTRKSTWRRPASPRNSASSTAPRTSCAAARTRQRPAPSPSSPARTSRRPSSF
jgi:peptide/nickel transport system substrate-binding protein